MIQDYDFIFPQYSGGSHDDLPLHMYNVSSPVIEVRKVSMIEHILVVPGVGRNDTFDFQAALPATTAQRHTNP